MEQKQSKNTKTENAGTSPYLFRVEVRLWREWCDKPSRHKPVFTGKIVKRLLLVANPVLAGVFSKLRGATPKLVHITPLYVENGKTRCLHTIRLGQLPEDPRKFVFYVGSVDDGKGVAKGVPKVPPEDMYTALLSLPDAVEFSYCRICADLVSIKEVDVARVADQALQKMEKTGKLPIIFSSPTMLRDPFVSSRYKSFLPSPLTIFSTPAYIYLYMRGTLSLRMYRKALILLNKALGVPYTYLKTVRTVKVPYKKGTAVPALAGYVNLYMRQDTGEKHKKVAEAILKALLPIMLALGTGTSRATGFGHITIKS